MEAEAALGAAGINAVAGLGGSTNGWSDSWGASDGTALGNSWYNDSSSSSAYGYTDSNANSWAWQDAQNWATQSANSLNKSTTYGREASAQDIVNAAKANAIQADLWQDQARYNAEQAQIARAWEEKMSNTAYQRAVADLKKAGLNPILAAMNMGATTPTAVSASSGLATSHKANAYAQSESYGKSNSKAYSYGYNKGKSGSEAHSKSENWGSSSSHGSGGSHSESKTNSVSGAHSEQTTQIKSIMDGLKSIFGK